ncbi:Zinc finger protein ZAT5 [Striga hermonthica]|uniref:Zinc finger protein ZAT5 n=1 Tax=Striga hermonthica TaxID=68872 RepID=A0A9N7NPR6_STRHE|nr:Zinc finger protein ZAT5 [Striga hermonthica]
MMQIDTVEEFSASADHAIAKGKRSKRPRPTSSAESHTFIHHSSPATSSSTEEDEDMANCLILLARGDSPAPDTKSSSRIFTEMAGIYVYECKTCNRTFPSFQALGGHRASHKRPKPAIEDDQKKQPPPDEQGEEQKQLTKLLDSNKICQSNDQIRPKIHECSICGSEFASGQALGGHMRRHRAPPPPPPPLIDVERDVMTEDGVEKPRSVLALDLDLNLPAPPEDDKFDQFAAEQKPRMVFSTAALVDCHY